MNKKIISLVLCFWLIIYSILPYGLVASVYAQEADPSSSPVVEQTVTDPSSSPSTEASPTSSPDVSPSESPIASSETEASVSPTQSPSPTPTPIPYWSDEYDALDDAMEAREDEWETHEDDGAWIAAHGGSEYYYTSGNWQRDEDARIAAEAAAAAEAARIAEEQAAAAAAAANQSDPLALGATTESVLTEDGTSQLNPCSTDGSVDSLALAAGSENIDVTNNNCLVLNDTTTASGVSGENSQTFIDGPVDTTTGDSFANGSIVNNGNTNVTDTSGAGSNAVAIDSDDSVTSDDSGDLLTQGEIDELTSGGDTSLVSEGLDSEVLAVSNTNEVYVNNELNVSGVSGENILACNDGEATLTTGDVELIANMLNILNLNITGEDFMHLIINIFGTLSADLDIDDIASALGLTSDKELEVIAQGGNNQEDSSSSQTTDINNDNSVVLNNEMNVSGVSGLNNVSGNDGDVDVVTGRIKILANLMNFINTNFSGEKWSFIMINIFGKLTGNILLPDTSQYLDGQSEGVIAENAGAAEAISDSSTSITNTNGVTLSNNMNVNGISGENSQLNNDDGDSNQSGEVDVVTKLMNFLNFNITGNNWVFLVVNVFGKWMGKIVNFAGTDMNAPTDGSFAALSVGDGGSVMNNDGSNISDTNVNNNNLANVNNTMNIDGISGQNALNGNDGTSSLTTGWVDIDANLLNIINMNVIGRSWMIVFLNIFGDFVGDLFFGAPPTISTTLAAESTGTGGETNNSVSSSSSSGSSSEVTVSASGGNSTAVVNTSIISKNRKVVKKVVSNGNSQVLSYTSTDSNGQSANFYPYLIIFGRRIRIPNILLKLFSNPALRKYLSFAHS